MPAGHDAEKQERMLTYRWDKAHEALLRLAEVESDPSTTSFCNTWSRAPARSVFPCIAAYLQMIRPGIETRAHRHNSSAIYFVLQGSARAT